MSLPPSRLLPPPSDEPMTVTQQALALVEYNPQQAVALLQVAAQGWLAQGERRRAALVLHRRAALRLRTEESPVADLAQAARLLIGDPEDRALVLLDLGHALRQAGDLRRATLTLRESEQLARQVGNPELTAAARHALSRVADEVGDFANARTFLRGMGRAMIYDVERDLLATLRDMGNLPDDSRATQERARRQQAIEDELAALKREMGLKPDP